MKLSEARDAYYTHSANASAVARQVAFAGIAIVWIFNRGTLGQTPVAFPHELTTVVWWLVVSLSCDLLQYVSAAAIWGIFHRVKEVETPEHRRNEDVEIKAPPYLNWPAIVFFWGKLAALIYAYIRLGCFLMANVLL